MYGRIGQSFSLCLRVAHNKSILGDSLAVVFAAGLSRILKEKEDYEEKVA